MRHLRILMHLFIFTLSFFSFVECTTRHSLPSASSQANSPRFPHAPKVASPSTHTLQPRARRGYSSFLSIGSGWNLYYSSWPGSLLPIQLGLSAPKYRCLDVLGRRETRFESSTLQTHVSRLQFGLIRASLTKDLHQARRLRPGSSLLHNARRIANHMAQRALWKWLRGRFQEPRCGILLRGAADPVGFCGGFFEETVGVDAGGVDGLL